MNDETRARILENLIEELAQRLKREPTEDEVVNFIYGDRKVRQAIWNNTQEEQQ